MVCFDLKITCRLYSRKRTLAKHIACNLFVLRLKSFGGTKANLKQHASEEATKKQRIVPKKRRGNSIN